MAIALLETVDYNMPVVEIIESVTFKEWLSNLRDRRAMARINARLRRVSLGNLGDAPSVGNGIYELRIHYGPGYRVYFLREGETVIILLCDGDKDSQRRDIERAKQLAQDWRQL